MKEFKLLIAFCVAIAVIAVALPARALSLGGYQGPILFELAAGTSSGTNYGSLEQGSYGGNAYTTENVDALDAIGTPNVNNASSFPNLIGTNPSEDGFGIGQIKRIHGGHATTADVIYDASLSTNRDIFVVYYGNEDFSIDADADFNQSVYGSGMMIDVWEIPHGAFDAAGGYEQGTGARENTPGTGPIAQEYSGISNVDGGELIFSIISEPGFISMTRPDATFKTTLEAGGDASGQMYASVGETLGGVGSHNWLIDSDYWTSRWTDNTADLWVTFTADTQGVPGNWGLNINDDAKAYYVPEPAAILLAFLAAPIAGAVQFLRRRKKKA